MPCHKVNKTLLVSLLVVFANALAWAKPATIAINMPSKAGKEVVLVSLSHYMNKFVLDAKGHFDVKLDVDKPGYFLLNNDVLYLEPGMVLRVDEKANKMVYTDNFKSVNGLLHQITGLIHYYLPLKNGYTLANEASYIEPADMLKKVDQYRQEAERLLSGSNNAYFVQSQKNYVKTVASYYLYKYEVDYGVDSVKKKEYMAFLSKLKKSEMQANMAKILTGFNAMHNKRLASNDQFVIKSKIWGDFNLNDRDLFSFSPEYRSLVKQKLNDLYLAARVENPLNRYRDQNLVKADVVVDKITDSSIKQVCIFSALAGNMASIPKPDSVYKRYAAEFTDPYYAEKFKQVYQNLEKYASGRMSPEFSFADADNKTVTLKDFRGKYVYLDLWATWCKPCIDELPALKAIQEKYAGRNLAFVSISIDNPADVDKWKAFVSANHLGGTQLMSNNADKAKFFTDLSLTTIPRFVLIDPNGKLVAANAYRPSNPKLTDMLDTLLGAGGEREL